MLAFSRNNNSSAIDTILGKRDSRVKETAFIKHTQTIRKSFFFSTKFIRVEPQMMLNVLSAVLSC